MSNRAISIVSGATFVLAASGSAFAADMGVPSAPPPAPVYNWTGWYAGVNFGASFGNVKTDFNVAPGTIFFNASNGPQGATLPGFAGSDRTYPDGFMGGGQIGYNWQFSPIWVVGVEADFQGAIEKDHGTLTSNFSAPLFFLPPFSGPSGPTATGTTALDYTAKIEWFGTVRVRAGYVWGNGNVMSYLTGGLAYGKVDLEGTGTVSGVLDTSLPPFSVTQAFDQSHVNTGWVAGYGTEGRLGTSNWTWKIEGLYMDLGHLDARGPGGSFTVGSCLTLPPFCAIATAGPVATHTHFTDGILRGGLNYKFY